ncbi:MAG TPA: hypothetical protein VKP03_02915 [Patescibacteria group bacterium]|nr:hypothetical protein [Patescibacteria group bacterium]
MDVERWHHFQRVFISGGDCMTAQQENWNYWISNGPNRETLFVRCMQGEFVGFEICRRWGPEKKG